MLMKNCLIVLLLVAFSSTGQNLKPVQSVPEKSPGSIVIPFVKYILPNGLTVVVHEDHSDPLVHVDITYHVGSAREEPGKSGFAHFFEHMMFQGSDHVGDDQHFKYITEAGGTLNGTTTRDRTNYFETVPANQLEKVLWLEADRMGFFLDAVTQKKFENQRATVKNERGQRYDNRPYGLTGEVTAKNLYPAGHPYSWLTIGYVEDLNRADLSDLKNFFIRWYGPNNATLTIGGDVKADEVIKLIWKYFGSIPAGPAVSKQKIWIPEISSTRFITLEDNYAALPQLLITFPTVPQYHSDMAALSCLAEVLGYGKTSVFFQHLVKNKIAANATAASNLYELSGEFTFSVTPFTGNPLKKLYASVYAALDSFEARGVTDDDIAKYKGTFEAQMLSGLQSVSGKVSQLASFQTFTGSPDMIGKLLEMNQRVTKQDVMRVYRQYIKGKPSVVVSVVPKSQSGNIAAEPNYSHQPKSAIPITKDNTSYTYKKGKDDFDRSIVPPASENPLLPVPSFWRTKLDNGIKIIGLENNELPLIAISISFPGGYFAQSADLSKTGLSRMLALMMNEDTQLHSAEDLQIELQKLGASIQVLSSFDELIINVSALKKNLKETLALVDERIFRPSFTAEALSRLQQQTLEALKIRNAQPTFIADYNFAMINYGRDHILGTDPFGTPSSVSHFSLEDVENFYRKVITSDKTEAVITGDIREKEAVTILSTILDKVPSQKWVEPEWKKEPVIDKTKIFIVDIPEAAQTEIRIGRVTGLKYDATGEFFMTGLMNYILGGSFSSRLNLNLREDKGWTYAARSVISGDKYTGLFAFNTSIKTEAADSAIVEIMKEMEKYKQVEPTIEELAFMRSAISQREALRYETLAQKAAFIKRILDYDLPADFVSEQAQILNAISAQEINALARKWLTTSTMNILLAGDKNKMLGGLKRLGYEIVDVTSP
jgi:zinc protease